MSLLSYLRTQWEYLLAIAGFLASIAAMVFLIVLWKRIDLAGIALGSAFACWWAACAFAEHAAMRELMSARRQQRAEDLKGDVV